MLFLNGLSSSNGPFWRLRQETSFHKFPLLTIIYRWVHGWGDYAECLLWHWTNLDKLFAEINLLMFLEMRVNFAKTAIKSIYIEFLHSSLTIPIARLFFAFLWKLLYLWTMFTPVPYVQFASPRVNKNEISQKNFNNLFNRKNIFCGSCVFYVLRSEYVKYMIFTLPSATCGLCLFKWIGANWPLLLHVAWIEGYLYLWRKKSVKKKWCFLHLKYFLILLIKANVLFKKIMVIYKNLKKRVFSNYWRNIWVFVTKMIYSLTQT